MLPVRGPGLALGLPTGLAWLKTFAVFLDLPPLVDMPKILIFYNFGLTVEYDSFEFSANLSMERSFLGI